MIRKHPSLHQGKMWVIFELPRHVLIESAYLVGDFNDWNLTTHAFHQEEYVWEVALELDAGREYQFRYLVNGEWVTDWKADKVVPNPYGSMNSVVVTRE